jgi:uncharacterized protein with GYD domain
MIGPATCAPSEPRYWSGTTTAMAIWGWHLDLVGRDTGQTEVRQCPAIEEQGGKVEAFYFAFGDSDAYVVVDMPDNVSAAAVGLIVSAAGGVTTRTVVLLTAEEMDAAAKRKTLYRPPGG